MASPVDQTRVNTNITTAATSWAVNYPTSIAAGDLLVMHIRTSNGTAPSPDPPSGWVNIASSTIDASDDYSGVFATVAAGGESGTFNVGFAASCKGAATVHRVSGASPSPDNVQIFGSSTGATANADPPVINVSPSNTYLIILLIGLDGETQTFTPPTNYSNLIEGNSGTGGAVATNCRIAAASRQLTFTSENPGAWTNTAPSNGAMLWSVVIGPNIPDIPVTQSRPRHRFLTLRNA